MQTQPPLLLAAVATVFLCSCGTTVSTRPLAPRKSLDRSALALTWKQAERQTAEVLKTSGFEALARTDPSAAVLKLAEWSQGDPRRLEQAGAVAVVRGENIAEDGESLVAAGYFLTAADLAYQSLRHTEVPPGRWLQSPVVTPRVDLYNYAIGRFLTLVGDERPAVVEAAIGSYHIKWPEARFDRVIATQDFDIVGFEESVKKTEPGVGVAALGIDDDLRFHSKNGGQTALTVIADFTAGAAGGKVPRDIRFTLYDEHAPDRVPFLGGAVERSVNYAAPVGRALTGLNDRRLGLGGFLRVGDRIDLAGVYLIEPYDPERIPVLMSHGLQSSPLIWRSMIAELMRDEEIRQNYQFWLLYYPSGMPVPMSAGVLRKSLAAIRDHYDPDGNDPASTNMVAVGHSMGGILTRTLIKDVDDRFWKELSDEPFSALNADAEKKSEMEQLLFWEADPAVERAIFFSAPHRGADMADGFFGRLGRKLVRLPSTLMSLQRDFILAGKGILKGSMAEARAFNSISSLSPDAPLFKALDASPDKEGVVYHSVIGDRGKGDTPDSSDGIVAYWSSHLDEAESELIVPTGHGSYNTPLAVAEMKRILKEHLD